jgi:hypothetical protein
MRAATVVRCKAVKFPLDRISGNHLANAESVSRKPWFIRVRRRNRAPGLSPVSPSARGFSWLIHGPSTSLAPSPAANRHGRLVNKLRAAGAGPLGRQSQTQPAPIRYFSKKAKTSFRTEKRSCVHIVFLYYSVWHICRQGGALTTFCPLDAGFELGLPYSESRF